MSTNREEAVKLKNEGNALFAQGGIESIKMAIDKYEKAQMADDTYAVAYFNCGLARDDVGEYEKAIADFNKAIELDPSVAKAYNFLGKVYEKIGNPQKAIENFNEAINHDKTYAIAYFNCGLARTDVGEYGKAIADFNKAIELDPSEAKAYYHLGIVYKRIGNPAKAIENFSEAINHDKTYAKAYYYRAIASDDTSDEDVKKTIDDFEKAIYYGIEANADLKFVIGGLYSRLHDYEKAISYYNESIKDDESCAEVYVKRGNAYFIVSDEKIKVEEIQLLVNALHDFSAAIELYRKKTDLTEKDKTFLDTAYTGWKNTKAILDDNVEFFKSHGLM